MRNWLEINDENKMVEAKQKDTLHTEDSEIVIDFSYKTKQIKKLQHEPKNSEMAFLSVKGKSLST